MVFSDLVFPSMQLDLAGVVDSECLKKFQKFLRGLFFLVLGIFCVLLRYSIILNIVFKQSVVYLK